MGSITTGVGLISGIDIAGLIDSLISLESRPKFRLQDRIAILQSQQTALMDVNARLLNLGNAGAAFRRDRIFRSAQASTTNEAIMTATATTRAQPGTFKFIAKQLVSTSQQMTKGFADRDTTPLGLNQLSFEFGKGQVFHDQELAHLNGGAGVDRGRIIITDRAGSSATIDLTDVTTLNEALDRINGNENVAVTATVEGDGLVVTDTSGGAGILTVTDGAGDTTATDLGIAGTDGGTGVITGTTLNHLGGSTALTFLNDGRGVLLRNNVPDLRITARDGSIFEVDLGRIDADITTDTELDELNNGSGVRLNDDSDDPDIKFIARDGTEHEVDLTGVTTIGGLISRVSTATGGQIQISIADGDKLTVTDTVGGAGNLIVEGAGGQGAATAEDLGILNETGVAADSFDGSLIPNTISDPPATTIQHVIDRINTSLDAAQVGNGGRIVASLATDGVSLQIDDTTGGSGNLVIESTSGNPLAASQLGIETVAGGVAASMVNGDRLISSLNSVLVESLNGGKGLTVTGANTLAGSTLLSDLFQGAGITTNGNAASADIFVQDRPGNTYEVEVDGLTTVQDLIDAFNTATGGAVTLAINGQALEATHNAGVGPNSFQIQNLNGASVADELGILADLLPPNDVVTGIDTQPLPPSVAASSITITDRVGASLTLTNLDTFHSISQVIDAINDEAVAQGVAISVGFNAAGNGLHVTDSSGGTGNLTITGDAADPLGIAADVAADNVLGSNLQLHYVAESTRLEDLNYGRGVGTGTFKITDGLGESAQIVIGNDAETLYDIIAEINSRGLAIHARINDNGDGLLIESNLAGQQAFVPIKVENVSGSTARDLNILGKSSTIGDNAVIDGSYEQVVDVDPSDSLEDVMNAINEAGVPVAASILNAGSGPTPYHLNLTSQITGARGEMIVDTGGVDLGIRHISHGQDAKVFFGSDDPSTAFLVTSATNSLTDVVQGVTIELHQASDEAVDITVTRDNEAILDAVNNFVTSFSDALGRINEYDRFDIETEERGVLLGDPTVGRVRQALYRVLLGPAEGVGGQFQFMHQVGITIGNGGEVQFDQAKFQAAYDEDADSVEDLFAAFEGSSGSTTTTIAPGVTINEDSSTVTARGFGQLIDDLIESMTNSVDGVVTNADKNFDTLIELAEDRIEAIDARLDRRREQLFRQFTAMETALAQLQSQQGALTSLAGNIVMSQTASIRR